MGLFWVVLTIVIISTVVGAVARLFNNLNENAAAAARNNNRPVARPNNPNVNANAGAGGGGVRAGNSDMDRFLAEIDRLRRKNAEAPAPPLGQQAPAAPVVQPTRQPDRPRPRVVAEVAEPARQDFGFNAPPGMPSASPSATTGPKAGDLPLASVVGPAGGVGAPATRVTRFSGRARPAAKTPFAKNLTALLGSGQGLALAVVLQEVLGPPKSKKG